MDHVGLHPLYERLKWWWDFYRISYLGGDEYLNPAIPSSPYTRRIVVGSPSSHAARTRSMLYPHRLETDGDFAERRERARYDNRCAPVIRAVVGHVLDSAAVTRTVPPIFSAYMDNTDGAGTGRDAWMRRGLSVAQVYGHALAVTEVPSIPGGIEPANQAEAEAVGQQPYSTWFTPLHMPDWRVSARGEFEMAAFYVGGQHPTDGGTVNRQLRVWYPDTVEDWTATMAPDGASGVTTYLKTGTFPNPIGRVPVDVLYNQRDTDKAPEPIGVSRLMSIAELNRALFNYQSLLDDYVGSCVFDIVGIPGLTQDQAGEIALGNRRYIGFSDAPPVRIAPPSQVVDILRALIADCEAKIQAISGLSRGTADLSRAARPAEALIFESADKLSELRQVGQEAADFERRNLQTVARWLGQDPGSVNVEYGEPMMAEPVEPEPTEPPA